MCSVLIRYSLRRFNLRTVTSATQIMLNSTTTEFAEVKSIFQAAVVAVEPYRLIENCVRVHNGHLVVNQQNYKLQKPCYVVAFGKAVFGMCVAIEEILGEHLKEGLATVPEGIFNQQQPKIPEKSKIKYIEGAKNNLPDENAHKGALQIKELVEKLQEDDLLIVLISGGGSALLPLPKSGVSLQEKMDLIRKIGNAGADIVELAKVRKQLSQIKGGGLAEMAYPARVITLILSDVIGDPLDYIAGGPTVPNTDETNAAIKVLQKYSLWNEETPNSIKNVLETKISQKMMEFPHVDNYLIGNNEIAINAAAEKARNFGYNTVILSTHIQGDTTNIAKFYAILTKLLLTQSPFLKEFLLEEERGFKITDTTIENLHSVMADGEERFCILGAGEPSVIVRGNGKGGRNQQLALAFSVELNKFDLDAGVDITFLSCGTDGIDGPTDAAGAIGTSHLVNNSLREGYNPVDYLSDNDSYGFYTRYDNGSHLIKVGHTGTNVMDIHVILINKTRNLCNKKVD